MTSNGGALLLAQADRRLGLTAAVARRLDNPRQRGKRRRGVVDMVRQRVFGIALGYEDLNDHADLRHDLALQTASGRGSSFYRLCAPKPAARSVRRKVPPTLL